MRALFDINLMLALFQPDHVHHERAHEWWDEHMAGGWASCPLTQNGFVRILSQARYPQPVTVSQALAHLAEQVAETDHIFWPDDASLLDPGLFASHFIFGPNQITDVYLLALAVKNGGRLATFDRSIRTAAVRGAEPHHLVTL